MLKYIFGITLFLIGLATFAKTNTSQENIIIGFRLNDTVIDADFADNSAGLAKIPELLELIEQYNASPAEKKLKLKYQGAASPEGPREINVKLAEQRLEALRRFLPIYCDTDNIFFSKDYIPWEWMANKVETSDLNDKEEILAIIAEGETIVPYTRGRTIDNRVLKLRKHNKGRTWAYLKNNLFDEMRFASVSLTLEYPEPELEIEQVVEPEPEKEPVIESKSEDIDVVSVVESEVEPVVVDCLPVKHLYIKTNVLRWLLTQSNIGIEVDVAPHWSVDIKAAYSACNYFSRTLKFRTTDIKPNARYWFGCNNSGWYVEAHFGLAWYNFAFDGKYRFQDHDRGTPAIGGGIGAGYRMPISNNRKWNIEFGVSAGAYRLHYDKFLNEPNGRKVGEERRTYIGPDDAWVTVSYRFDLNGKGGGNK